MLNKLIDWLKNKTTRISLFIKIHLQTAKKHITVSVGELYQKFLYYKTPTFRAHILSLVKNLVSSLLECLFGVFFAAVVYISILSVYYLMLSDNLNIGVLLWFYPQYLIKVLVVWLYQITNTLMSLTQLTLTYLIAPTLGYIVKVIWTALLLTAYFVKYILTVMYITAVNTTLHTVLLIVTDDWKETIKFVLTWIALNNKWDQSSQLENFTIPLIYELYYINSIFNAHFMFFLNNFPTFNDTLIGYNNYIFFTQLVFEDCLTNPWSYSQFVVEAVEWMGIELSINLAYNTLLWTYLIVILVYSVYRNINYSSITSTVNSILFILMLVSLIKLVFGEYVWSVSSDFKINNSLISLNVVSFYYDELTFTFLFTIYAIGFIVHRYQFSYLNDSPSKEMFLITFNTFILSMVGVVSTSNWLLLLLSWEVLGLSSFFLIGYYKGKPAALKSALKAFIFNKLSDLFLIIAFAIYYFTYNTFYIVQQPMYTPITEWIGIFLLLTAFVKSAQFCFYFWLPDSMEAPIPASALIHSATLVSAGIYLTLRFIDLIEVSTISQYLILSVSSVTMVFASLIAYNQTDIKKLLAYSTIANCGFIYFLIFLKAYKMAMIYFIVHGVIKSFSFIIAGDLIIQNNHIQDMRKWTNFNLHTKLKLLLLIIVMFLLSGAPISLVYTVKSGLFYSNYTSTYVYFWVATSLLLYTLNSYLYGLKLVFFLLNKQVYYRKYRKYTNHIDGQGTTNSLLFILYLYLIIGIVVCSAIYTVTAAPVVSWKWLISILVLSAGFVYSTIVSELAVFQVLLSITLILNFII